MTPEEREALMAARLRAVRDQPYLAVALHALVPRSAPIGTFAVDPQWRLYVDPVRLLEWSVPEVAAVLVHEVWHLLRDHAERGQGRDRLAWNLAADAEINDDLLEAGLPLPGVPVTPQRLGLPDGLLAEAYYAVVEASPRRRRLVVDCGSGADGVPRSWEEGAAPGLGPVEAAVVVRATAQAVAEAAPGTVPGEAERWAGEVLRPTVDWRRVLAGAVRSGLAWASGASDYTSTRPSRRAGAVAGVVLPSLRRPVPRVAVVVDTSASVDDELLAAALAEVDGVLAGNGVRREAVTVLAVDTEVQAVSRVRAGARVALRGGGGTDLRVGLAAAVASRPRPDVVVVLTDGHTPWPDAPPPGVRVVVALLGERPRQPPAWAVPVRVVR